jgi:MauM/NapG family ferredoxin protein
MADEGIENLPPHDRRGFFTLGLARLLRPLADYVEDKLPIDLPAPARRLRPPGAIEEREFLATCFRCGNCADACPADAIALARDADEQIDGTPCIDADLRACVMCDELACMKACPSGALVQLDRFEIRIGLAHVDEAACTRSAGEDCTICLDSCPLGSAAIGLDERGRVRVIHPAATGRGCTGCGVCQQHCPTTPVKAIRVRPW